MTGTAVMIDGELSCSGSTPSAEQLAALAEWAARRAEGTGQKLLVTDNLGGLHPPAVAYAGIAAGLLLLPLNQRRTDWVAWFRAEVVTTVHYGSRRIESAGAGGKDRFSNTVEQRRGHCLPWSDAQVAAVRDLRTFLREIVLERYAQLSRINRQLKTAYDEMEAFSYTVSHDLRAPLRGIDGFAEILLEEHENELKPGAVRLVNTIQENAARMNRFISEILELSRVGRRGLTFDRHDTTNLIQEAVKWIDQEAGSRLVIEIDPALPPIVGDRQQLAIVYRQLLSNARKYSGGASQPIIRAGFRRGEGAGEGEFFVSDNGIGIAADHQHRVFGMFNRLVSEADYPGLGVGLTVAQRIIQRHNGNIRIESEPGRGATFLFHTNVRPATDP